MARQFNGTTDAGTVTIDLSSFNVLSAGFWLWWDAFANDDHFALGYGTNNGTENTFFIDPNSGAPASGSVQIDMRKSNSTDWADKFTRPSAGAWHHWLVSFDRPNLVNYAWIDGVPVTLSTAAHTGSGFAAWGNLTLHVMNRNSDLFGAGRMAELSLWAAVLTDTEAAVLNSGVIASRIRPQAQVAYWPMDSNTSARQANVASGVSAINSASLVLTGTSVVAGPSWITSPSPPTTTNPNQADFFQ